MRYFGRYGDGRARAAILGIGFGLLAGWAAHGQERDTQAQAVQWRSPVGMRAGPDNGRLSWDPVTVRPGGREAGAHGHPWISGDGAFSFRIANPGRMACAGLTPAGERLDASGFSHAFRSVPGAVPLFEVRELNKIQSLHPGTLTGLDSFRTFCIRRRNGIVRYEVDGVEVFRSAQGNQEPLQAIAVISAADGLGACPRVHLCLWTQPGRAVSQCACGKRGNPGPVSAHFGVQISVPVCDGRRRNHGGPSPFRG
jgi:hypothetical protein